ncbi:DUF3106 domain-containing protein [Azoarcus taiwanensis]|uniref:DUF3106 domain-containing protein n=1 Tax=Azoarcus taiwanensis TaxID=666964 RepID=A0A972FCP0_9RHOO|nr:DUF3106 domain-containing protein [Azoarcus taiwanensis]NMG02852.1 DUF3106 domain-containing protein [Azoarcus taiwanensis]
MARTRIALLTVLLALAVVPGSASAQDWTRLTPSQQRVLAPLQAEWASLSAADRRQWLAIGDGFEGLTPEERARATERMREWANLSAAERDRARQQYRALRSMPPDQRESLHEQWEAYRKLSPGERQGGSSR